jgi:hypothetical protein
VRTRAPTLYCGGMADDRGTPRTPWRFRARINPDLIAELSPDGRKVTIRAGRMIRSWHPDVPYTLQTFLQTNLWEPLSDCTVNGR